MRKNMIVLIFMVIWAFLMTTGLLWGFYYEWPDYVHTNHGLPLTWATHTLSTITGPADRWAVNVLHLLLDLVFWLTIAVAAIALLLYKLKEYPTQ